MNPFILSNLFFGNLNSSHKELLHNISIERDLEKISFEFTNQFDEYYAFVGTLGNSNSEMIKFYSNTETNLFYRSYSLQKLETRKNNCDNSANDQLIFSHYYSENCRFNCNIDLLIKKYKCLVREIDPYFVDIDSDLKIKNYKFCSQNVINASTQYLENIIEVCYSKCPVKCNLIYYEVYMNSIQSHNSTKLNLIPISSHHMRYTETLTMGVNEFIYNLGGVMGLWFGLSPLSMVYLITLIKNLEKN